MEVRAERRLLRADLLLCVQAVAHGPGSQWFQLGDAGQQERNPAVMHPLGGNRKEQRQVAGAKKKGGSGHGVPQQQLVERRLPVEAALAQSRKAKALPKISRLESSVSIDESGIREHTRRRRLLLQHGSHQRQLFRAPGVVLIAKRDHIAATKLDCLFEVSRRAQVARVAMEMDRESGGLAETLDDLFGPVIGSVIANDELIRRESLPADR